MFVRNDMFVFVRVIITIKVTIMISKRFLLLCLSSCVNISLWRRQSPRFTFLFDTIQGHYRSIVEIPNTHYSRVTYILSFLNSRDDNKNRLCKWPFPVQWRPFYDLLVVAQIRYTLILQYFLYFKIHAFG